MERSSKRRMLYFLGETEQLQSAALAYKKKSRGRVALHASPYSCCACTGLAWCIRSVRIDTLAIHFRI